DYNATELNLEVGDRLEVVLVIDGWYKARAADGQEGWIPARVTRILRQGKAGPSDKPNGSDPPDPSDRPD
ncbi:MAG: SH3 domain-containing protein, partial [Oceanipulchritudo sp.]